MSTDDPEEARRSRERQKSGEKFEAVGRFVQSFELMVQAVRAGVGLMSGISGKRGLLLNIILHHQVMSAKPLMDVFRAIANTIMDDATTIIPDDEKTILRNVITQVANRYQGICDRRNDLLHGTWYIGWCAR